MAEKEYDATVRNLRSSLEETRALHEGLRLGSSSFGLLKFRASDVAASSKTIYTWYFQLLYGAGLTSPCNFQNPPRMLACPSVVVLQLNILIGF